MGSRSMYTVGQKIYTFSFPVTSPNQQLLMAALRSRCRHYILVLFLFFFFPLPNLSGRRLHVYHISTRGVALVRISNAGLICAAHGSLQMQDLKSRQKFAIWAPSHSFVGLYLCNWDTYQQSEIKLVKQQCLPHMSSQYRELWPTGGWDLLASLGHPS